MTDATPHTATADRPFSVLFLCTGNSARSVLSEALLRDAGGARFAAYSAGSHPSGTPHPDALRQLEAKGHSVDGLSSKSWNVFSDGAADAPEIDLVVTVCNAAAGEACPVFRTFDGASEPMRVHWPAPDPAAVEDADRRRRAFADVYRLCRSRIEAMVGLSDDELRDAEVLRRVGALKPV